MSEKRYKLHLTDDQLEMMKDIMNNYDWFCDCENFPNCKDFKMFKKLKNRINKLSERSFDSQFAGHEAHRKLKTKYMIEGRNI